MGWSLQQIMEGARETEAKRAGVLHVDIVSSRLTGMDARDIANLRAFTLKARCLLIFRCPRPEARAFHGVYAAKSQAVKSNTGSSGVVVDEKGIFVSDYDFMSAWRVNESGGYSKIFLSGVDAANPRSRLTPEATDFVRLLNAFLVTRIQHGAQDDWASPNNRGVKETDRFAAIWAGRCLYLPNKYEAAGFYRDNGLAWPYDELGRYTTQSNQYAA